MARYSYKARNNAGALVSGDLTGSSEQEIIAQLRQMEYTPIKIIPAAVPKAKSEPKIAMKLSFGSPRVKVRDLTIFCTNLSSMTNAGIPLLNALSVIGEQLTNAKLADAVLKVSKLVSEGSSFSDALAQFPDIFSNYFINMIRTAEISGTLDKVLKEMANYLEKEDSLISTVRGMMIYPTVLVVVCISVVVLIITFIMPQFVQIFVKAKVPLPLMTNVLYQTGIWIKKYPLYYFPAIFALSFGITALLKTDKGKKAFDRFILKMPLVGSLINKTLIARFCRSLGLMLETGVPILQSFTILQQVLGNIVYVEIVDEMYKSVEKGEGIGTALLTRQEFPKDVTYMISVGEKTGNIVMMLNKIADFYEAKVNSQIKEMMALIEPAFVVIIGAIVGCIMASIILPMFDMIKTVQS